MELLYKPDFERAQVYWQAFWEHEVIDRPLVCVLAPQAGKEGKVPPPYMAGADGRFAEALTQYDEWASGMYFGGELLPYLDISLGPDQFSAFLGADLVFPEEVTTSWVKPFVTDWSQVHLQLQPDNAYWKMILDYYQYAAKFSDGKFLLGMLDLHTNIDCLSAIRGPENLCMDIMDCPNEVEQVLNQVRQLYAPVYEAVYGAGNMATRGSIGWAPTYCQGKFATIQCDFSCMLSPQQARKFVIPAIAEEAAYLDHCVYHYDGKEALGHLDDILAIPDIDVIQWVPGDGNPRSIKWMELLKRIQKANKGLWIYDWTIDEIKAHYQELRPEGLVFQVSASSESEADDLVSWLKDHT